MTARSSTVIELLQIDGCPSAQRLLPDLERLAAESGATLLTRTVKTVEDAQAQRFLGSPTVRVDGVDIDPTAHGRDDFGLKCRIYRSQGGQSPVPPLHWLNAALCQGER